MILVSRVFAARSGRGARDEKMPSLFRLLISVGLLGGLAYGAIFSLANFVPTHPREIIVTVPPAKFIKQP